MVNQTLAGVQVCSTGEKMQLWHSLKHQLRLRLEEAGMKGSIHPEYSILWTLPRLRD
jgi:hypothetical protein